MQSKPLNTAPIIQFIQQVRSADLGNSKEVKLNMQNAKRLSFALGEVMARLEGDLEEILASKSQASTETIKITMDGGNNWNSN